MGDPGVQDLTVGTTDVFALPDQLQGFVLGWGSFARNSSNSGRRRRQGQFSAGLLPEVATVFGATASGTGDGGAHGVGGRRSPACYLTATCQILYPSGSGWAERKTA